jgi:predicted ATP-grasp superfamily ATP-dependent carboligase
MSALHPDALVWKKLDNIKSVKFFSTANKIPKTYRKNVSNIVIIPLMETHLYEMPTNFTSLTSTPALVQLMADKLKLTENLNTNGFARYVPKTWTNPTDSKFPCIIKRRELNGAQGIKLLKSFHELHNVLSEPEFNLKSCFFQDFISSDVEYVCHIVALNGEILFSNYFEYTMPNPEMVRGWDSPTTNINRGSKLNLEVSVIFKEIIKLLNYTGPCNIDFKMINGVPKIFEINPRLGGSLMVSENLSVLEQILKIIIRNAN